MNKKQAIIYVRVSNEEQTRGYSLNGQERLAKSFAQSLDYEVVKVFREEGVSAKDLNRPCLKAMMEWARENKDQIDALIFWKWERISRGTESDYAILGNFFKECNITPLSVTECNEDSPEGELLRWITKGAALYERRKIAQRTIMGMEQKAKEGYLPGKAPIGYKNVEGENKKRIVIIDKKIAPFIKKVFELYASGNYSFKKLSHVMYLDGFIHPRTKEKFPPKKFEWMLKNPFYMGQLTYRGITYQGKHEPLISEELFYQVQSMFGHKKPRLYEIFFPYTNMIRCDHCGGNHNLSAEMKRGANNSGEYVYYRCKCNCKAIKQEQLEKAFINLLNDIHIPKSVIELVLEDAKELLQSIKDYENTLETPAQLEKKIKQIKARIKKSYQDKLDNTLPHCLSNAEWENLIFQWSCELQQLEKKLIERKEKSKILYNKTNLILSFCQQLPQLFKLASPQQKREIIQTLTHSISYNSRTLYIKPHSLF